MELSSNLNVRVNKDLKKEADDLFKRLGMNMSTAINIFLTQSVKEQAIPFTIKENKPNKRLIKALKEADKMAKHPEKYKGYHNLEELIKDLEK